MTLVKTDHRTSDYIKHEEGTWSEHCECVDCAEQQALDIQEARLTGN